MIKLWVDDIRTPPDKSWIWARSYQEAIYELSLGNVTLISLDHDLGVQKESKYINTPHVDTSIKTGYDVICWIEESVYYDRLDLPMMLCHSMNPVGRKRIETVINKLLTNKK